MHINLRDCCNRIINPHNGFVITNLSRSRSILKVKGLTYNTSYLLFKSHTDAELFIQTFIPILSKSVTVNRVANLPQSPRVMQCFSWTRLFEQRCQDCACLALDSRNQAVCDESGTAVRATVCCPEGLAVKLTYGDDITF